MTLRPYANPLPLGLLSFGVGMAVLAGVALDLVTGSQVRTAGILLVAFVFPPQSLAAVVAFLTRDTGAAGVLGLFAASWAALGTVYIAAPTVLTSTAVGMFLAAFAAVLVPLAVTGFLGKGLLGAVLTVSIVRAALAAAYQLGAPKDLQLGAGAAALLLFALALYAGSAFLFEDIRRRTVLPIKRRGTAQEAVDEDIAGQHDPLPRDPGVRKQL